MTPSEDTGVYGFDGVGLYFHDTKLGRYTVYPPITCLLFRF